MAKRAGRQRRKDEKSNAIRFHEKTIESLSDYIQVTNEIYSSWTDDEEYTPDCWYRGVSDAKQHRLQPSFYRLSDELDYLEEDDYREEFMRRAPGLLDGRFPKDNWEWYFLMQHNGLPTRLLDWTEGSLTALFFAIESFTKLADPTTDAAVWMLDPWYLNEWSFGSSEVLMYSEQRTAFYLSKDPFTADDIPTRPAAIMPTYNNNRRLAAQRGMFTIHGADRDPLEEMLPKHNNPGLAKIIIPKKSIVEMRDALRRTGVTDVVLFPELPALALDMRRSWERP